MFKRSKTEAEFADFNSRKMPLQVVVGTLFLTFIFTVHFVTLRNTILDMTGLVIAEFVISVFLLFAMIIICFSFCFRRILELALTTIIGVVRCLHSNLMQLLLSRILSTVHVLDSLSSAALFILEWPFCFLQLFSFRAALRVAVTALSIETPRLGSLGLFAYDFMGFAETLMLLIIPYHMASFRWAHLLSPHQSDLWTDLSFCYKHRVPSELLRALCRAGFAWSQVRFLLLANHPRYPVDVPDRWIVSKACS